MAESLLIRQVGSAKRQHVKDASLLSWTVQVAKDSNHSLGLKAKKQQDGLLILAVSESGALGAWNQENPFLAVLPGDKIVGVNGDMDNPWHMIESMWQSGSFSLQVSRKPTEGSNFKYVDNRCVLASEPVCASDCGAGVECLPHVCVREANKSVCTVCFEEYTNPDARLVQLPCKHAFHPSCIAMWFEKGKCRCPMCNFCVESGVVFGKM